MPPEITLEDVQKGVTELRAEVEKKSVDHDKVERIQTFLDEAEEKVIQPLNLANQEMKARQTEIAELTEKLEKSGVSVDEQKARIDALEVELARGGRGGEQPNYHDGDEYKAVNAFCRGGFDGMETEQKEIIREMEKKQLLRTDVATEGGILVPVELDTEITKKITEIDPIRAIARVRSIGGKSMELPIRNTIPSATYEGEAEEGSDSTSTYQSSTVTPFRQTFTTPITLDQLMDAAFDMEAEIASDAAEAFAFGEGQGFVTGTGFKQPAGFVANANLQAAARDTAASGVLDPEAIILLTGDLKVGYDPVYVLNRRTLAQIRTFRADAVAASDAAGNFLWMPGFQDGSASGPVGATLNGHPYVLANSMPDVGAGTFPIAFGDFRRGYTIVDRQGMTVIRDEFSLKKKGIVEFTMNRWNTGQVTLEEPIRLLRVLP